MTIVRETRAEEAAAIPALPTPAAAPVLALTRPDLRRICARTLRVAAGCTPLQLAARLGMDKMFRHILKKRTRTEWTWGPVSEHHIPLEEIDSANSHGERTVSAFRQLPMAPAR